MNLQDIRAQLANIADHSPSVVGYTVQIDSLINQAYEETWFARPWVFTLAEQYLPLRPDITSETSNDATITIVNGTRFVDFSGTIRDFGYPFYEETWSGQVMEIEGREYPILWVNSESILYLAEPYHDLSGNDGLIASTDWVIKHRYYRLPPDCTRLMSFVHADRPLPGTTGSPYEVPSLPIYQSNLVQSDVTSDWASCVFRDPDLFIPPGERIDIDIQASASDDALPDTMTIEVCWSFKTAGHYGPLSESIKVTVAEGDYGYNTVEITCLDYTDSEVKTDSISNSLDRTYPTEREGLKKVLWFNANIDQSTGARIGAPCWIAVTDFSPTGKMFGYKQMEIDSTTAHFDVLFRGCFNPAASRYVPHNVQQIRPYPRVNAFDVQYTQNAIDDEHFMPREKFKRAVIQYLRKPRLLFTEQDTPEMPPEFHNLIVYKALENLFIKLVDNPQKSSFYALKYDREVKSLERRYVQSVEQHLVKQQWGVSSGNWLSTYPGPVSIVSSL